MAEAKKFIPETFEDALNLEFANMNDYQRDLTSRVTAAFAILHITGKYHNEIGLTGKDSLYKKLAIPILQEVESFASANLENTSVDFSYREAGGLAFGARSLINDLNTNNLYSKRQSTIGPRYSAPYLDKLST